MANLSRASILLVAAAFLRPDLCGAESPEEWIKVAQAELERALKITPIVKRPKNVVFFLGDGMGINTLTASRIYKGQMQGKKGEEISLSFEKFPHVGLSKTYNDDAQIPDSAGSATAFFSGQKASEGVLGVNSNVKTQSCSSAKGNAITSILEWAQQAGKATGIVTTTRITHATPAATYAHTAYREWEYQVSPVSEAGNPFPDDDRSLCKDIAQQLIEDEPGKSINVIFGGGRRGLWPAGVLDPQSVTTEHPNGQMGRREDGRNLIQEWIGNKTAAGHGEKAKLVANVDELNALTAANTDYVLGLFAYDHLEFDLQRSRTAPKQPTLTEMTKKAIELLSKHESGFFLMVEGGRIDHAHHDGFAKLALHDTVAFDAATEAALAVLPADETLFVVTADHSHVLSIGGYAERGLSIFKGMTKEHGDIYLDENKLQYLTLQYSNGPGARKTFETYPRRDVRNFDTESETFQQDALVPLEWETHGGEDVAIYAKGPFAHLFHSLHEQNYIPIAIDYAACYRSKTAAHCTPTVPPEATTQSDASVTTCNCSFILLLIARICFA